MFQKIKKSKGTAWIVWKAFDYLLSAGTIAWGLWAQNWYIAGAGVLGLVFAYFAPAEMVQRHMRKKIVLEPGGKAGR